VRSFFSYFFVCFFSVRGEVSLKSLLPIYISYTSSWIFWSFDTSYRVPNLPRATANAPVAPVRSLNGDRTALPFHRGRRLEPTIRARHRTAPGPFETQSFRGGLSIERERSSQKAPTCIGDHCKQQFFCVSIRDRKKKNVVQSKIKKAWMTGLSVLEAAFYGDQYLLSAISLG